ncbi:MAG TPA: hypothetical protein VEA80_06495 [Vitreimonas sp.]|uniref:hypothetical protein n=1 Tax=Vitreimonas sp. TaxID=3069702 RepID=UPI002D5ADD52|nr:hypothetical protein [Vitreimonas sp.]HYD87102.1 hypothetical protein [Vitreimonas sp.]
MTTPEDTRALIVDTVEETLQRLGIDVSTPEGIEEFRADLRFAREMRTATDEVKRASLMAAVGTVVTGGIAAILLALRHWLLNSPPPPAG